MADNTVLAPEKVLGSKLGKLTQKELICLIGKLCAIADKECDESGFRGGFRPGNIYIDEGKVFVGPADKAGEDGWTKDELEYMAPEVFWNGKKSARADVYSIGLLLFVGLNCGNVPFVPMADYKPTPEARANALRERMNGEPVVLHESIDGKLRGICMKAVAFDADERFENPAELAEALRDFRSCEALPSEKPAESDVVPSPAPVKEAKPAEKKEAPSSAEKPAEPETTAADAPAKKPTGYEKKSRRVRTVTFIIILILLAGVAVAVQYIDPAEVDFGEWFNSVVDRIISKPEPTPTVVPSDEPTQTPEPTPSPEPTQTPAPEPLLVLEYADLSWDQAENKCRQLGGHLVTITSQEEYDRVCEMLSDCKAKYVWIGCYRNNADIMTWVSGAEGDFFKWADGEPSVVDAYDGANEDYLMLVKQKDGTWLYNDNRMDPFADYGKYYKGKTAYICQIG